MRTLAKNPSLSSPSEINPLIPLHFLACTSAKEVDAILYGKCPPVPQDDFDVFLANFPVPKR